MGVRPYANRRSQDFMELIRDHDSMVRLGGSKHNIILFQVGELYFT